MLANAFKSSGFTGFQQLSKGGQLILAECLEKGSAEIDLPANDMNADFLARMGWLKEEPTMTPGWRSFTVPVERWRELLSIRTSILTPGVMTELQNLKARRPKQFTR